MLYELVLYNISLSKYVYMAKGEYLCDSHSTKMLISSTKLYGVNLVIKLKKLLNSHPYAMII